MTTKTVIDPQHPVVRWSDNQFLISAGTSWVTVGHRDCAPLLRLRGTELAQFQRDLKTCRTSDRKARSYQSRKRTCSGGTDYVLGYDIDREVTYIHSRISLYIEPWAVEELLRWLQPAPRPKEIQSHKGINVLAFGGAQVPLTLQRSRAVGQLFLEHAASPQPPEKIRRVWTGQPRLSIAVIQSVNERYLVELLRGDSSAGTLRCNRSGLARLGMALAGGNLAEKEEAP